MIFIGHTFNACINIESHIEDCQHNVALFWDEDELEGRVFEFYVKMLLYVSK